MAIKTRSIRAVRRQNGKVHAEIVIKVSDVFPPTAWEIEAVYSKHPYSMIDGHRYDLTEHEIQALRRAVNGV